MITALALELCGSLSAIPAVTVKVPQIEIY